MTMDKPDLIWEKETPYSNHFSDIYYSKENGLLESEYVFIKQNHLEERWQSEDFLDFVISETGFGTGLNFLATCKLWKALDLKNKRLHFISLEKYPLTKEQLQKAHHHFPELIELSNSLINAYPKRVPGLHRINYSSNITLDLYFGDVLDGLKHLDDAFLKVDAWFFDGFSPDSNHEMWTEELFSLTRKFNKAGTSFATFTSAGHVRRKLEASGFSCKKIKGFGHKREMLTGIVIEEMVAIENKLYKASENPWFISRNKQQRQIKKVAVIGAGLAGSWTAFKLAQKGLEVDVFESASKIADGASGNSRGATYFKLDLKNNIDNKLGYFYLHAYLYSIQEFNKNFKNDKEIWDASGLLQLPDDDETTFDFKIINEDSFDNIAYWIDEENVLKKTGIIRNQGALYFPCAGSIGPEKMCISLLNMENIRTHLDSKINNIQYNGETWSIESKQVDNKNYDALVIANSYEARQFEECKYLPLNKVRGQSTQIKASPESKKLGTVICSKGYLTPEHNGAHTIGSTFDPRNHDVSISDTDNTKNIEYLKQYLPDFYQSLNEVKVLSAKAALRCQTADLLPILGQLCDRDEFMKNYSGLAKGQLKKPYPATTYISGLYVNLAHASRGLISTPYCAEILSNMILNQPLACDKKVKESLSANRFYLRQLKKSAT